MSVLGKKWIIKNSNQKKKTIDKILENRGLNDMEIEKNFHDPFLFNEMEKAVKRIQKAIEKGERVIIFGDYDVDGITGTAILVHLLKMLNANVSYRLPHRLEDGYGLSKKFIDEFISKDVKLLITVDCGISCYEEIKHGNENGIDTIITDHHTIPKKIPEAYAILHPKGKNPAYPFKDLTGAGVALKLAHALILKKIPAKSQKNIQNSFIDLAALGTVADLGPLKGENWLIVKKGLENLSNTKWIGLKKIMQLAAIKEKDNIDSETIGFRIAPRINAAGRIGDPYLALSLLLQEKTNEKINLLGAKLEKLNFERKKITIEAFEEMEEILSKYKKIPQILIAENENWHVGILGLVAGKLVEKYARPAIIMQDFGDILIASARSPEYFDIIKAITKFNKYLISFGGHAQAAGFNIKKENLQNFKKEITVYTKEKLKNIDLKPILEIDCEIKEQEINMDFINDMEKLKPFGVKNQKPTFLLEAVEPHFIDQVGRDKNHLKFSVKIEEKTLNVIAFRMGEFASDLRKHRKIDLVFHMDKNYWNNKENIQLQALDFRETKK